jgi:hypothetical protein
MLQRPYPERPSLLIASHERPNVLGRAVLPLLSRDREQSRAPADLPAELAERVAGPTHVGSLLAGSETSVGAQRDGRLEDEAEALGGGDRGLVEVVGWSR